MLLAVYLFRRRKDGAWVLALGYIFRHMEEQELPSPKEGTLTLPLPCHKAPSSPAHQVCLPPLPLPLLTTHTHTPTPGDTGRSTLVGLWSSLPLIRVLPPSGLSGTGTDSCWQAASEQPSSSALWQVLEAKAQGHCLFLPPLLSWSTVWPCPAPGSQDGGSCPRHARDGRPVGAT